MASDFDPSSIDVTPEATQAAFADGSAQLIDVRTPYEWDAGRIDGALHIAMDDLRENIARVDTDRPVVFCCTVGARSRMAAEAFRSVGVDAYSMAGGLLRWANEGRPLSPEGGVVATH
jgi:hydroxyacylglutathione hydrolase/adenylyltransferase/sulfurtransferase